MIVNAVKKGDVLVDRIVRKGSYRLKGGEEIRGYISSPPATTVEPLQIDFPVLYEDEHLLLISKPPGLVVHPGSGNSEGTLVSGLLHYCREIETVGDRLRPGLVHRLDKDTSGVMLVAKQEHIHRLLTEGFKKHAFHKEYLVLVYGVMREKTGTISAPVGRHPVHRQKMSVQSHTGKHAVSSWTVLAEFSGKYSLVRVAIETGRTHQIRVHLEYLGNPVAGDSVYGGNKRNQGQGFARQMLHAARLCFLHPVTGQEMDVRAPLWPDFAGILDSFGWKEREGK